MAYDTATRKKVRAHYVQGKALTVAAELAGVPYNTCRTWKRQAAEAGDDWDTARTAQRMTKSGLQQMANEVLGEVALQFTTTLEALKQDQKMEAEKRARILVQLMDGYNKAIGAAARAAPEANRLATAMDVIKHLTDLFAKHHPKLRAPFVAAVEQLGDELLREFGAGAR